MSTGLERQRLTAWNHAVACWRAFHDASDANTIHTTCDAMLRAYLDAYGVWLGFPALADIASGKK